MDELSILIITDEPIFSYGLRVQLQQWGFACVEITNNCTLGLQSLYKRFPSLLIIDEKILQDQTYNSDLGLIAGMYAIPTILLSVKADHRPLGGIWEINKNYTYLHKPCKIEELKAAVENLLQMNLLQD